MKLWADGKVNYNPPKFYLNQKYSVGIKDENGKPIFIQKSEIQNYVNDNDFWRNFEHWQRFRMFGLKQEWFEYPKRYIDMIETFEAIYRELGGK